MLGSGSIISIEVAVAKFDELASIEAYMNDVASLGKACVDSGFMSSSDSLIMKEPPTITKGGIIITLPNGNTAGIVQGVIYGLLALAAVALVVVLIKFRSRGTNPTALEGMATKSAVELPKGTKDATI